MLTIKQKKWINHLPDNNRISIIPLDPTAEKKFKRIKEKIQTKLGANMAVKHRGATSLGISGQDEIDIYIPASPSKFNSLIAPLTELFGQPGSHYPLERARFETCVDNKHVTVFLINKAGESWLNGIKFEQYLKLHPKALETYQRLKEESNGLSTREYYRKKIEFINSMLAKTIF